MTKVNKQKNKSERESQRNAVDEDEEENNQNMFEGDGVVYTHTKGPTNTGKLRYNFGSWLLGN